jgi:hypothetical protein
MKIYFENELILDLSETQKNIIKADINADEFEDDMKRRLVWIIEHKIARCFERLKSEWESKLIQRGYNSLPTNYEQYAEIVFAQEDYKSRKVRDEEEAAALAAN